MRQNQTPLINKKDDNMAKLTHLLPKGTRKKLKAYLRDDSQKDRERKEARIAKVPLADKHMANCELLLNRSIMLSKLKKGGSVAEIGVDRGEFSEQIIDMTEPAVLHLVDTWGTDRYHSGLFESVTKRFENYIDNGRVKIDRKMSTEAAADFAENYFDWIYIDTDHSYKTTREELRKYAPKMKADGIIAGHDYSMGNWTGAYRYGVIEAVHEFCVEHDWELVFLTLEPIEGQSFAIRRIR